MSRLQILLVVMISIVCLAIRGLYLIPREIEDE